MTATEALTEDLKKQVIALEDDLRRRVDEDPELREEWQRTHRQATEKERTAWSWVAVARRPGQPDRGRLGADERVHPLLRGQRARQAGLDHGAGQAPPGGPRTPSWSSSASTDLDRA